MIEETPPPTLETPLPVLPSTSSRMFDDPHLGDPSTVSFTKVVPAVDIASEPSEPNPEERFGNDPISPAGAAGAHVDPINPNEPSSLTIPDAVPPISLLDMSAVAEATRVSTPSDDESGMLRSGDNRSPSFRSTLFSREWEKGSASGEESIPSC